MNPTNKQRLVDMRKTNPEDDIYFVYDSALLDPKAIQKLEKFCHKHHITPLNVSDIRSQCTTEEERNLLEIYDDEINHLNEGGNLGAASDILRWLRPIYQLGTYSDFDTHIDTRKLPQEMSVKSPLLFNMGSIGMDKKSVKAILEPALANLREMRAQLDPLVVQFSGLPSLESLTAMEVALEHVPHSERVALNTDIMAVVDADEAEAIIQRIQTQIYKAYHPSSDSENVFFQSQQSLLSEIKKSLGEVEELFSLLISVNPFFSTEIRVFELLREQYNNVGSLRKLRQAIIESTKSNEVFRRDPEFQNVRDSLSTQEGREELAALLGVKSSPPPSADVLVTILREKQRFALLTKSVMYSTGPGLVGQAVLQEELVSTDKAVFKQVVSPYSFEHYKLNEAFSSGNGLPLCATEKEQMALLNTKEVGQRCDVSWLQEGQAVIDQNEMARKKEILSKLASMRDKIKAHKEKVQADLDGSSFFKQRRTDKRDALKEIEGFFREESSFDVEDFFEQLSAYRENPHVSDAIGKSKTRALIEELAELAELADIFDLVNEDGQCSMVWGPSDLSGVTPSTSVSNSV